MPNTYTQSYHHIVFAVKFRKALIVPQIKSELYSYIISIIQKHGHRVLRINGTEDHIHILVSTRPHQSLSQLIQEVKRDSSKWINKKSILNKHFSWQEGFAAFSYSQSQIPTIARYIERQEEHHKERNFLAEYRNMLQKFDVDYDESYIFRDIV